MLLPDDLTLEEQQEVEGQLRDVEKDETRGLLLCISLGFLGAHRFYLGQVGWGVVYLVMSVVAIRLLFLPGAWLPYLPAIVLGLIYSAEAFVMSDRVHRYNDKLRSHIVKKIKKARPIPDQAGG